MSMAVNVDGARRSVAGTLRHRRCNAAAVIGLAVTTWALLAGSGGPRTVAATAFGMALIGAGLLIPTIRAYRLDARQTPPLTRHEMDDVGHLVLAADDLIHEAAFRVVSSRREGTA